MRRKYSFRGRGGTARVPLAVAGLLVCTNAGRGQEALRLSMAGDYAASLREQTASSIGYYNLLLGPTAWRFASSLGMQFTDNARLQRDGEADLVIRPNLNAKLHWPVTAKNSLDVSIDVGYSEYVAHSELSELFIRPGSGLFFDVYVGDFKFNLHDRVTVTEQSYENAGIGVQNRNLVSLQNTAGIGVLWDLNKAFVNLGFDHANYVALSQGQGEPDAATENILLNCGLRLRPEIVVGVETGYSIIEYHQIGSGNLSTPNANQWNAGCFTSLQISPYLSARLDAGYSLYSPENSADVVLRDASGLYCTFSLSHRVNQYVNYTFSAGRSTDLAAYGQPQTYYFIQLNPQWNLLKDYAISTPIWWREGSRVYDTAARNSDYDQLGLGLSVSRGLTRKLSAAVNYQFVEQTSNGAQNYTANNVGLNLSYQF